MSTKVWLSTHGRALDPEDATISVFDRGFLYGDSVYETMRTVGRRVVDLDAHLDRLRRSGAGISFEIPFDDGEITQAIAATLEAADNPDSRIRVIVTRGVGPITLDTHAVKASVLVVMVTALELASPETYARGIAAALVDREGAVRPGLKTGNYLGNILALREAQEAGADDAIMCNPEGAVAEGATSNLFLVVEGSVHTPSLASGVLAGITRGRVMQLLAGELGLPVAERTILPVELERADELFLTSSVRGVMPVTRLDGRPVGDGSVGPITKRLRAAYDAWLSSLA